MAILTNFRPLPQPHCQHCLWKVPLGCCIGFFLRVTLIWIFQSNIFQVIGLPYMELKLVDLLSKHCTAMTGLTFNPKVEKFKLIICQCVSLVTGELECFFLDCKTWGLNFSKQEKIFIRVTISFVQVIF